MKTSPVKVFVELLVNLKTLLPVLNLGLAVFVGSGITKVPEAVPVESVVSAAPADEPVGVTLVDTSTPSKNGNILVSGFISFAVNVIVLGLINCANATLTTLSPKLVLTALGIKDVLTPVLNNPTLCSVVIVVVLSTLLPCLDVSVLLFVSRFPLVL